MIKEKFGKIILIGYRTCGKSVVGRRVAKALDYRFLDLDRAIEAAAGRTISEMVAAQGWEEFRARERAALAGLIGQSGVVVATGGGAIIHRELWPALRRESLVVWLNAAPAIIRQRLTVDCKTEAQRPALTDQGTMAEIAAVLAEREPLYREAADLTIDTGHLKPAQVAELIMAKAQQQGE